MLKIKTIVILILLCVTCYFFSPNRWVDFDRSIIVQSQPIQKPTSKASFSYNKHQLKPVAAFDIEARVLSRRTYRFDKEAKVSPMDLALGWGRMSDYQVIRHLKISQWFRWYHYYYGRNSVIASSEIISNSANMHLIPSNKTIERKMKSVRRGSIVRIQGFLVNVTDAKGWSWNSSLTRTDTGDGSCEIIWVKSLEIK